MSWVQYCLLASAIYLAPSLRPKSRDMAGIAFLVFAAIGTAYEVFQVLAAK